MRALQPILIALAAMLALAAPSEAQESEQRVTGHELCLRWQEQARGMFPVVCADDMPVHLFNRSSQDISARQLVVSVLGGTDETRLAVLQVVHGMVRERKSVAIAFGPDRDRSSITMEIELYARGNDITTGHNRINVNNIDRMSTELIFWLEDAYKTYFPPRAQSDN